MVMTAEWWLSDEFADEADGNVGDVRVTLHREWFALHTHVGDKVVWHGEGWEQRGTVLSVTDGQVTVHLDAA